MCPPARRPSCDTWNRAHADQMLLFCPSTAPRLAKSPQPAYRRARLLCRDESAWRLRPNGFHGVLHICAVALGVLGRQTETSGHAACSARCADRSQTRGGDRCGHSMLDADTVCPLSHMKVRIPHVGRPRACWRSAIAASWRMAYVEHVASASLYVASPLLGWLRPAPQQRNPTLDFSAIRLDARRVAIFKLGGRELSLH